MTTRDNFIELLETDNDYDYDGCPILQGLQIIANYMPGKRLIEGADHDIIYSVDIDTLIDAGITVSDVIMLGNYNWHVADEEYLANYV